MKKKLIVHLEGGLGNQLFQYAFSYAISKLLNSQLYIDNRTGFFLDFKFGLKFELPISKINYASILDNVIFILFRIFVKFFKIKNHTIIGNILLYHDKNTNSEIDLKKFKRKNIRKIYLLGFFQNPKLFKKYKSELKKLILLNIPDNNKYKKYKKKINLKNSICVGIRFWEETGQYNNNFGGVTSMEFYKKAASKLKVHKPNFFIFSKVNKVKLKSLNLPGKIFYVPIFKDKNETLNNLWLMSNFKYFIISNSTFYWWAAFLSDSKKIIISNKFKNKKTIPKNWRVIN